MRRLRENDTGSGSVPAFTSSAAMLFLSFYCTLTHIQLERLQVILQLQKQMEAYEELTYLQTQAIQKGKELLRSGCEGWYTYDCFSFQVEQNLCKITGDFDTMTWNIELKYDASTSEVEEKKK